MLEICEDCVNKDYKYCLPFIGVSDKDTHTCSGYKKVEEFVYVNIYKTTHGRYDFGVSNKTKLDCISNKDISRECVVEAHKIKVS